MSADISLFNRSELTALKATVVEVRRSFQCMTNLISKWTIVNWIEKIAQSSPVSNFSSRVQKKDNKDALTIIIYETEKANGRTTIMKADDLRYELGGKFEGGSIEDLRKSITDDISKCVHFETLLYPYYGRNYFFVFLCVFLRSLT